MQASSPPLPGLPTYLWLGCLLRLSFLAGFHLLGAGSRAGGTVGPTQPKPPHGSPSPVPWGSEPGGVHHTPQTGPQPPSPRRAGQPEPGAWSSESAARADKGCQLLSLASLRSHRGLGSGAPSQLRVNPVGRNEACLIEASPPFTVGPAKPVGLPIPSTNPLLQSRGRGGVGAEVVSRMAGRGLPEKGR